MQKAILILAAAFVFVFEAGGRGYRDQESESDANNLLAQRIQAGDGQAIAQAGRTGNRFFVPFLRQELKDRRNLGTSLSPIGPARVALARLGEKDQLQEEWCRAISDDPKTGLDAPIQELGSVGGWFAIQALQKFLTPEGQIHWRTALARDASQHPQDKDVMLSETPTQYALEILPQIVPDPPLQFTRGNSAEEWNKQVNAWQDWIGAHREELSKLQPTGEGVDFSANACKNGKPRKKH